MIKIYNLFFPINQNRKQQKKTKWARSIQQKSSYLEGKLNKKIASESLPVIDDPFLPRGIGSRHFDCEGIVAKPRVIIDKGILKEYYIDNYYGKKLGMEPNSTTGDFSFGIFGLYLENGKIIKPVNEINITGNLDSLWKQLHHVGNDPYKYSSLQSPSIYFKNINFSGI